MREGQRCCVVAALGGVSRRQTPSPLSHGTPASRICQQEHREWCRQARERAAGSSLRAAAAWEGMVAGRGTPGLQRCSFSAALRIPRLTCVPAPRLPGWPSGEMLLRVSTPWALRSCDSLSGPWLLLSRWAGWRWGRREQLRCHHPGLRAAAARALPPGCVRGRGHGWLRLLEEVTGRNSRLGGVGSLSGGGLVTGEGLL